MSTWIENRSFTRNSDDGTMTKPPAWHYASVGRDPVGWGYSIFTGDDQYLDGHGYETPEDAMLAADEAIAQLLGVDPKSAEAQ